MNLDTNNWRWFSLKDIFGNCERGTRITKESREKGEIAFVTAGEFNEGVSEYISNDEAITYDHCLTIDMFCNCFYHGYQFKCDDNVLVLSNEKLNYYNGVFIACIVSNDKYKFSYGRQYRQADYQEHMIKLPAIVVGNIFVPDWEYMENYTRSLFSKKITTSNTNEQSFDISTWKEFWVSDCDEHEGIFKIENCKCGAAGELVEGNDVNYIGAKKNENGVMKKVAFDAELISDGNGIMFICDGEGSVGYTNYMDKPFIGSTTTSIGYNENLNKYNALFIVTVLDMEKFKYSYGRKYRMHLNETKIKLPAIVVNDNFAPDWEYMENFIKNMPYGDKI